MVVEEEVIEYNMGMWSSGSASLMLLLPSILTICLRCNESTFLFLSLSIVIPKNLKR